MSVALLVMTDGRDTIRRAIPSCLTSLYPRDLIEEIWIHDDTGTKEAEVILGRLFPRAAVIPTSERLGFGGAIEHAWALLRHETQCDYIFHLEDDFIFKRPVSLPDMISVLEFRPDLMQLALLRQPWNEAEIEAGGIIQQNPEAFEQHQFGEFIYWNEHSEFFTTNPSLYRTSMIHEFPWPTGRRSEQKFTNLALQAGWKFGYWGHKNGQPWVEHIGDERVGTGY